MNQEMFLRYRRYQYCLRQQKLCETFSNYEPATHLGSSDRMRQSYND